MNTASASYVCCVCSRPLRGLRVCLGDASSGKFAHPGCHDEYQIERVKKAAAFFNWATEQAEAVGFEVQIVTAKPLKVTVHTNPRIM